MLFCFLYNVVSENFSVQNSPWGRGGLLPAQGLLGKPHKRLPEPFTESREPFIWSRFQGLYKARGTAVRASLDFQP